MTLELEHAVGCNVEFKAICHLHPNGKDYVKAVGGVVIVGDLSDPHEQSFLKGHDDFVTCVAVSNRGHLAASGQQGANADVILWDLETKTQKFCFQEQDHGIDCICFSHDDRFLVACSDAVNGQLFVYDCSSALIIASHAIVPRPTIAIIGGGMVKDIKRRETQEYLFAACGGKTISMWHLDPSGGEIVPHPVGSAGKHTREWQCMAFAPDQEHLFSGTTTGDIGVVQMKNRVMQVLIPACTGGVMSIVCLPSHDGISRVIAGGGDGTVTYLEGRSPGEIVDTRQIRLDGCLKSMSLGHDATEVMAVSDTGSTFLIKTQDPRGLLFSCHNQVSSGALYDVVHLRDNSELFLTCGGDGIVTLWDANDYSARMKCGVRSRAYPVSVAGTEDIIVAGCTDGRLLCYDSMRGEGLWHIDNAHGGGVTSLQVANNVRFVLSGGAQGELRIWKINTREMACNLKEHQARVNQVALFPNDQFAISVSRDRSLLTWDLRTEKRLTAHRERHGGINCMAIQRDQTSVITAGQEKTLTYWDLRMADAVRSVDLDEEVHTVGLSPDDRYLATAGSGMKVKIWDLASAAELSVGAGHSRVVQKLSVSPDGKQVVSVGLDHSVMVWNFYA